LDAAALNPVGRSLIDTSDKSYSFANWWSVEDFPWGTVRARTYNYPFSEGDLPDRARYVRLFFGLKGTGTMWLDNVDFRYSKWNFSALERLKPYIDRPLSPAERLIPTPKEIRWVRQVTYLDPADLDGPAPYIVLPDDPAPADRAAARLLEEKLNAVLARIRAGRTTPELKAHMVESDSSATGLPNTRLIFSIGRNRLMRDLAPDVPLSAFDGREQGYVITPLDAGPCHVVFLTGASSVGNFYAAATAAQLLDGDRGLYHSFAVIDYPDFLGRSYLLQRWETPAGLDRDLEGLELMSRYKLNKAYVGYEGRTQKWYRPDDQFKTGIEKAGRWCRENGVMSLAVMANPYSHFGFEPAAESLSDEDRYTWTHGDEESMETIQRIFKIGLDAGAGTVMLLADDYVPHEGRNRKNFSLYTPEDRQRFGNLQTAQAHVIGRLKRWIDEHYPGTRFEFCPPWYANEFIDRSEGKAEIYMKELTALIPQEIAVIWTGPTVRSLSMDMADLHRYQNLIGRRPMFWDNTLYARNLETPVYGGYATYYPGKVRMCNLFEPLDVDRPDGFHLLNAGRHIYVNGWADSEIYRIKFATVADYEWNTAAYDPEGSLWKALVNAYGARCGREVLLFNDAYYGLYGSCMWMERQGVSPDVLRTAAGFVDGMRDAMASLRTLLPDGHRLLRELEDLQARQRQRLEHLAQGHPAER